MGFFSRLGRKTKNLSRKVKRVTGRSIKRVGSKKALRVAGKIGRSRLFRRALKAAPIVGTAYAAYDIAKDIGNVYGKPKSSRLAPPALAGIPMLTTPGTGGTGIIPKGPGGRMQLPWSDPSTPTSLQQFSLDDQYLKTYYRAPKGYVVVRDANGRPFPMLKWAARKFGMWKPNKKPPISVGEHQAIKRADRAVKKIKKAMTTISRVDRNVSKGGKVVCRKKK